MTCCIAIHPDLRSKWPIKSAEGICHLCGTQRSPVGSWVIIVILLANYNLRTSSRQQGTWSIAQLMGKEHAQNLSFILRNATFSERYDTSITGL